jgi:DNA invertase Pin-like site-specific DNA recombinase
MRVALYARASVYAGQDPAEQLRELRQYCQRRGFDIGAEFTDTGSGAEQERRPQRDELLARCRTRQFDAVVVCRYDRFARSLRELVNTLGELDALGIHFLSLHEGLDTSTPDGRLAFGILGSIVEFERELIRDRVRSGIAAARARGTTLGRPRRPVDPAQVATLRAAGRSWREVGRALGVAVATARAALQERTESSSDAMAVSN